MTEAGIDLDLPGDLPGDLDLPIAYACDDGGRAAAGRKGTAGDCLVRAIAIVAGLPYLAVYRRAAALYHEQGFPRTGDAHYLFRGRGRGRTSAAAAAAQRRILRDFGFAPARTPGRKSAGLCHLDYATAHDVYGDCIARICAPMHWTALRGGALRDTWDSRVCEQRVRSGDRSLHVMRPRRVASIWIRAGEASGEAQQGGHACATPR